MTGAIETIAALRGVLESTAGVASAYLFGSVAEGRAHRESDVDVGVLFDRSRYPSMAERFDARLRLLFELRHAVKRDVDVVVLNDTPPQLARHIMTSGAPIVGHPTGPRSLPPATHAVSCRGPRTVSSSCPRRQAPGDYSMTYLVERVAELRRHLTHLQELRPRVPDRASLERDLSLHNDVMFSLLMVAQLTIDLAGELSARRGDRFEDYTEAVRNLARDSRFPATLVRELERIPGFRNVVIHEYVAVDLDRVVEALSQLEPVEEFLRIVAAIESES
jgi:uncharacterized protein YutE (UPF0331/DUF86 family)/predicted nucleotidyltransferase